MTANWQPIVPALGPVSDGAHRLAWWLAPQGDAGFARLIEQADVPPALIDRLLSGLVIPEPTIAIAIARETEGDVLPEDWARLTRRAWLDRPLERTFPSLETARCR